jgi:catechol 2,3-dioxygenase-like lactoylglutathione lyase family enzyme
MTATLGTGGATGGAGRGPIPTLRGIEHISMTVPDLDEATEFFTDVFGCQTLYTMGPFTGSKGSFMRTYANADVRTVVHHVRVLRSPYLNVELFDSTSPRQRQVWPDFLDIGGWHISGYVDDLDAAIEYLGAKDVYLLGPGKKPTGGPEAGEGACNCHCMSAWGFRFELVSYPNGRVYEASSEERLWHPGKPDRGALPRFEPRGGIPTFRGFEHVSMAVADLDEATDLLVGALGCTVLYDLDVRSDRHTSNFGAYANVDVRAAPTRVRLFRSSYMNFEVVECPPYPGQNRLWPGMHDVGGWHLAFYVDDVDRALEYLADCDLRVLGGKKPAYLYESGEEAYTVHCLASFGFYFELVTYPHGRLRAAEFAGPAWHPAHPAG